MIALFAEAGSQQISSNIHRAIEDIQILKKFIISYIWI